MDEDPELFIVRDPLFSHYIGAAKVERGFAFKYLADDNPFEKETSIENKENGTSAPLHITKRLERTQRAECAEHCAKHKHKHKHVEQLATISCICSYHA